ncbi:Uu.00g083970.m01.CDS01 [Anthostomella pinea]|uniref:Uu.00g083970.m01.CDS01 n=1 Tax=Anthostomella pinea TaxID=933095 RepID=A0AAI8VML1_9PEZI|nr:Uu.00g083970.m01.CDS01 [Anthostomella pinea]
MAFFEDPRMRQRWNQISQTTETVTENAAAGIWTFGHTYINPCFSSVASAFGSCTHVCLGDREERVRRARDRQQARGRAEYSFDFYDDWDEDLGGPDGGFVGGWRSEDWDRLLAGTGKKKGASEEVHEQSRSRNRGMSYGTRGSRRKASGLEDPTIIPSTAPLGFLGRLPFKIGGTLRYKPSAANLQEHPGSSKHAIEGERVPLLGADHDDEIHPDELLSHSRKRSGTADSGDTSDSFRSRGDLFPSDEEGEEDAIALDDEFTIGLEPMDDRSSSRTKSSKGKRTADYRLPRSVSRTTINSARLSLRTSIHSTSNPTSPAARTIEDLHQEEAWLEREEDEVIEKKRQAAADLALRRGLSRENLQIESVPEVKSEMVQVDEVAIPEQATLDEVTDDEDDGEDREDRQDPEAEAGAGSAQSEPRPSASSTSEHPRKGEDEFVPARLPYFR